MVAELPEKPAHVLISRLIDSWQAAELSVRIVGMPEFSATSYSGLYFRLKPEA
jgi:hypothetical protein